MAPSDGEAAAAGEGERLWKVSNVGAYLGCSKSWVYQKTATGELPCLNIGGLLRFDPDEIRAWAKSHRQQPAKVVPLHR